MRCVKKYTCKSRRSDLRLQLTCAFAECYSKKVILSVCRRKTSGFMRKLAFFVEDLIAQNFRMDAFFVKNLVKQVFMMKHVWNI